MSEESKIVTSRIASIQSDIVKTQRAAEAQQLSRYAISQEGSEEEFNEWSELAAFNPLAMSRRFESLEVKTRRKGKEEESEKAESKERKIIEVKRAEEISEQFQRKNPELVPRSLLLLRSRIIKGDSKEEILKKVLETYPDYSLADEALDFLLETSDGELNAMIQMAKEELNARHAREIRAGRNMGVQARKFAEQGLGTPTSLRDMYRDITGNPRDATALFEELSSKFTYEKLKSAIDFILHALGADLKSKGPSIARAELYRLMTESRTLAAILGVYRFFKSRLRLIVSSFKRAGSSLPPTVTFETLAKFFVKLLSERYPTSDKVLQLAAQFGITEDLLGEVILFIQMRDAVRQVAPKLFRSEQHRQDILMAYIEAIEELEERMEKDEDEEEDKKKKKS